MKRRWYIVIGVILVMVVILGYQRITSQVKKEKQTAYTVKKQDLKETLSLSGTIDAEEHVTLRFQSSGRLAWVGTKEGDYVEKYQAIASLDQRELQENLKRYLNTFVQERNTFDTTTENEDIKNTGGLSEDARRQALRTLKNAQYDLNNSVIDVELKQLAIEYSGLVTPIEGLVVRAASPYAGVNITPTQAEFEIINPKTIYFAATADQTDVANISQGQTAQISLDAYPDQSLSGKIYMISFIPKTGETGTVYLVKLALDNDNSDYRYRFGMTGDADFTIKERDNVLSVPSTYIKTEKGKKYVLKKSDIGIIKAFIEVDEEIDNNTIITSGLKEGDIVYD